MTADSLLQLAILTGQCILVAALILTLFRLRSLLGIGPLYAVIGLFQYMQVFLASSFYVEMGGGLLVSPGSSVLFTASLFTVLVVYIREDALEVRRIIYALVIANILMSLLLLVFGWHFSRTSIFNPFGIPLDIFRTNARVFVAGTLTLLLDALLIIVLFEFISRYTRHLFLRMLMTMALVVSFDTLFFALLSFWGSENLGQILASGILSKNGAVIVYAAMFCPYLKYLDPATHNEQPGLRDVFAGLSYRQKFETVSREKEQVQKEASQAAALSQRRYDTLASISPVGIFLSDAEGLTTYVNPRWCEISGMTAGRAMGFGWLQGVHPEDREQTSRGWNQATGREADSFAEYRFLHADGSVRWVLGYAVPERGPDGETLGYVGTITDITRLKNYEAELEQARMKAEESDRLKTAFLMNMSHEIRTPMNGILGFLELLRQPGLNTDQKASYIDIVNKSGQRLLDTINDIIELSRIEAGQAGVRQEQVNLWSLMQHQLRFFEPQAASRGLELSIRRQLKGPAALVLSDPNKLNSILTNLIKNALKFTREGRVAFGNYTAGEHLVFFVEDTGAGIPADRQEAIFERFTHADMAITREHEGSGLGLSIVKACAEALGGTVAVRSSPGKGSTFTVRIPYQPVEPSLPDREEFPGALPGKPLRGKTILVAEDDEISFEYLEALLEKEGAGLIRAADGREAVEAARKHPEIHLALMDIKMPVMDGLEATLQIKAFRPGLPVIAQTAYAILGDREKALEAGCDDYLSKPITRKDLIRVVYQHIRSGLEGGPAT
jgi:PAS domain S-box-containing protein